MTTTFDKLKEAYTELSDLGHAAAVLAWDQQTQMPPLAAEERGRQLASLSGVIHERFTAPAFDDILGELRGSKSLTPDQTAFVREFDFNRKRSLTLPTSLVKELAAQESKCFDTWQRAKKARDWKMFAPDLGKLLALVRRKAECYGNAATPWDALVPDFERGMTAAKVTEVFAPLREATIDLLDKIRSKPQQETRFLDQKWPVDKQREFGMRVARDIGYNFEAGRQDVAPHPFCTTLGHRDVRITTRFKEDDLFQALGSTVHECGHALYEQGFPESDASTPLAEAPSMGLHESQSRFWEVRVAQSRAFWNHYSPIIRQYFPGQFEGVDAEMLYRAVNRVEPSLIRVEADEVTYNLHIIIRFEIEVPLLAGEMSIDDVPHEWNKRYKQYLGVDVPHDGVGALQDVHWSGGSFGYFPSYTFGNIYGAMLVEKMEADLPGMWKDVEQGRFAAILGWLRTNIHAQGRRLDAPDLVNKVTGKPVACDALIAYLRKKYGEIYGL